MIIPSLPEPVLLKSGVHAKRKSNLAGKLASIEKSRCNVRRSSLTIHHLRHWRFCETLRRP